MSGDKQNADALSRAPVDHVATGDELGEGLPSFAAKIVMMGLIGAELSTGDPTIDPVLEKIKRAAAVEYVLSTLVNNTIEFLRVVLFFLEINQSLIRDTQTFRLRIR